MISNAYKISVISMYSYIYCWESLAKVEDLNLAITKGTNRQEKTVYYEYLDGWRYTEKGESAKVLRKVPGSVD